MEELRLINGLKHREEWAYDEFFREYAPKIGSVARSYLGADDVDDIVQEVLLRVFKSIRKFRGDSKLSTWVYRITVNVCKTLLQKYKRMKERLVDFSDDETFYYLEPRTSVDVLKQALDELNYEIVMKAMELLSPNDRLLIKLRDIDGLSYDEIAEIINKPLGTVKSSIHNARKRLKNLLKGGLEDLEKQR